MRFLPATMVFTFIGAAIFRAWCLQAGTTEIFRWLMLPSSLDTFGGGRIDRLAHDAEEKRADHLLRVAWASPCALALACWFYARNLRGLYGTGDLALALSTPLRRPSSHGF